MSALKVVPELVDEATVISEKAFDSTHIPKKRGKAKIWKLDKCYDSFPEAEAVIENEKHWRLGWSHDTIEGRKINYVCNQGPSKVATCPVALYLLLHSESLKVSLYRSENDHENHVESRGIDTSIKEKILELYNDGIKRPKAVLEALRARNLPEPTLLQIANFLGQHRKQKFGSATINVSDLISWCEQRSLIPENLDKVFVVASRITVSAMDENEDLQVFVSTKRLLTLASNTNLLQVDATYKLNWQGYPVLVAGASDKDRRFHPFGLAVCYGESEKDFAFIFESLKSGVERTTGNDFNPTVLMADGSTAITNAFYSVFGRNNTRLMCYFHVVKDIETRLKSLPKDLNTSLKNDVDLLQLCPSTEEFGVATELFLKKWRSGMHFPESTADIAKFMDYFENTWIKKNQNWYEGACLGAPSTNNGLESLNASIKKEHTFRERLPMAQFLDLVENTMVKQWSVRGDTTKINHVKFSLEVSIQLANLTHSYQWARLGLKMLTEERVDAGDIFFVPSSKLLSRGQEVTEELVENMKSSLLHWDTFDKYRIDRESIYLVTMERRVWKSGSCGCPYFLKHAICKHLMGIAIRLGLVEVPTEAKQIPIGQKRKRGRPSKAKAALVK